MKRKITKEKFLTGRKTLVLAITCAMLLAGLSGCGGKQETVVEEPEAEETVAEVEAETDTEVEIAENVEAEEEKEIFPLSDISYEEYLSDENGQPTLGYNIPGGWQKNEGEESNSHVVLSKDGKWYQSIEIFCSDVACSILSELENKSDKYVVTEEASYESPIGTFRIFYQDYVAENYADSRFAILILDEHLGIAVRVNYTQYESFIFTMDTLLDTLFGEMKTEIAIPDNYEYYLQEKDGSNIFGVNALEGYTYYDNTDFMEADYISDINFYTNNNANMIRIYQNLKLYQIYQGISDFYQYDSLDGDGDKFIYSEKGTMDTIYGTVKLYDAKGEVSNGLGETREDIYEAAILEVNGAYITIEYREENGTIKSDEIKNIVEQLTKQ